MFGTVPMACFIIYWPCLVTGDMVTIRRRHLSHTIAICMLRLSRGFNPFIYGFANKSIRNESQKLFGRKITILSYPIIRSCEKQFKNVKLQQNIVTVTLEQRCKPKILHMDPL